MITKEQWLNLVSKVDQTFEDEFKAEYNSPELMFPLIQRLLKQCNVMRSCIHCGNNDQSKFEVWEELDYNDSADEPHTGGNYLVNVKYGTCLVCGENL